MIDFELSGEQLAWQKIARDFSEQEIRPIAERLALVTPIAFTRPERI